MCTTWYGWRGAASPTCAVGTQPFVDEALEQARLLDMPAYRMVFVPHPVQLLTADELLAVADAVFDEIVARLVRPSGHAASDSPTP